MQLTSFDELIMVRSRRNLIACLAVVSVVVGLGALARVGSGDSLPDQAESQGTAVPTQGSGRSGPTHDLPAQGPKIINGTHSTSGFVHPGVLVSAKQLEFVRERIRAGAQPWLSAFDVMSRSKYADLAWQPKPRAVVECGLFSVPNNGCGDEWRDAVAAYTHALLWYLTGREAHAKKAAEILDAWSTTLRDHTNQNAPIQAGWAAISFVRAAELVGHTYGGWPDDASARVATMFRTVFLPRVGSGGAPGTGGNWDLIIIDAAIGISVFLDDRALFDQSVARWRARVPAFIYLTSDGPYPLSPPGGPSGAEAMTRFWFGQTRYADGMTQETCRDLGHAAWGVEAMTQVAETARIQGIDLYGEAQERIVKALEFHAGLELDDNGLPEWLCGGDVDAAFLPIPELGLNHYGNRRGVDLPRTTKFVGPLRPQPPSPFSAWETLTHAGNPN